MKKITNREKVLLGSGVVVAIGIIVYFFLLPVLASKQSKSDLKTKQEKLQSIEQLRAMEPMITELEKNMRSQLGYSQISFERNSSADAVIMKQLAQIANQSDIKEIEQLDVKPDKSKKSLTDLKGDQTTLKSTVDRLYMSQITMDKDNPKDNPTVPKETNKSAGENPKNVKAPQESKKDSDNSDETSVTSGLIFPLIPQDIPEAAKQASIKFVQAHDGQTITNDNVDEIISSSGIKDKQETDRIKKRLIMYGNRIREKKNEIFGELNKLGILQDPKLSDKAGRFTAKMVFKSDIGQLIRLLYNIQTSARWVKVDGIQITMADRQKALLGVELSLTAIAVYD